MLQQSPLPPHMIEVDLGDRRYDILIDSGIFSAIGRYIRALEKISKIFVVTDENVARFHLSTLEATLTQEGLSFEAVILPPGEQSKNFSTLESLLQEILRHKPDRHTLLIALGGGVIGDLTGFAASILLRGVPFIQVPTTLLAQVDSSVGGKTGINTIFGKNLIGSFYQPSLVVADSEVLKTLDKREYLAGYAEVVKYGLISQPEFFEWLTHHKNEILAKDPETIRRMVMISCKAKADIVAQDEREQGMRALLNLGHTFGHALESDTGYSTQLLHGEAVAIGMVMAFDFSVEIGICPKKDALLVKKHLKDIGLPTSPLDIKKDWDIDRLIGFMQQDKKVLQGKLVFVLARAIGSAFVAADIDVKELRVFLNHSLDSSQ